MVPWVFIALVLIVATVYIIKTASNNSQMDAATKAIEKAESIKRVISKETREEREEALD